jgi:phage shock protein PspC (stress-responsive transcriptional regulator)
MMLESKRCPYCAEEIRSEAVKCRYCGSFLEDSFLRTEWRRKEKGKMIAGVCAGLADHFDVSVTAIRLAFVIAFILGFGTVAILYVVLWLIMPLEESPFAEDRRIEIPDRDRR